MKIGFKEIFTQRHLNMRLVSFFKNQLKSLLSITNAQSALNVSAQKQCHNGGKLALNQTNILPVPLVAPNGKISLYIFMNK
jgi:hypothetical protein